MWCSRIGFVAGLKLAAFISLLFVHRDSFFVALSRCCLYYRLDMIDFCFPLGRRRKPGNAIRPYRCDGCFRTYIQGASLYRHKKFECGKAPQFRCPFCPHVSKRKENLSIHVYRIHIQPSAMQVRGQMH
ncbi:hypothetical protein J6590_014717 [Homalodisca vitripennis]|nr:hypothetical protein J6590_014717 [Homalodisca vitripennis]